MKKFETLFFEIIALLKKELSATITKAEQIKLEKWKKDPRIRALLEKLHQEKYLDKKFEELSSIETQKAFEAFYAKVNKPFVRLNFSKLIKIAAAILIPLFIGGYLIWTLDRKNANEPLSIEDAPLIMPGNSMAELILSSGDIIKIGQHKDTINEVNGLSILSAGGGLTYNTDSLELQTKQLINTTRVPRAAEIFITLNDGTKVWMNSESELTYPVPFSPGSREVQLKGEAYFEVTPNKDRPFRIITSEGVVKVLGTSFNLRAYPDEDHIYTTLEEGSVSVSSLMEDGEQIFLEPGYQAVLKRGYPRIKVQKVNTTLFTGWKDGLFRFEHQDLESILNALARWYNIDIFYEKDIARNYKFTGDLKKYESINPFLEMIEKSGNATFRIVDNAVIVSIKK